MTSSQHPMLYLTPDPLIGQNVGGYIVEQPMGEGGMGLVYRARHPILNRYFAVKVLRPEIAADAAVSIHFVREAQTLSGLKHPHIIDIVGFGPLEDGRQFMVTEFLEGQTLEQELSTQGQLPTVRALSLADDILDALTAAHSVDVIHRDLKPANVFLSKVSGGGEQLKLLDFGLAKQAPEDIAKLSAVAEPGASVLAGTPEYIAPEQALGKAASRQSDLYSFGVMFYEMLTGVQPFLPDEREADRVRALLKMHLFTKAPSIRESAQGTSFPADLEELVADLLKKKPEERPPSAEIVRIRLEQIRRVLQPDWNPPAQTSPGLNAVRTGTLPMGASRALTEPGLPPSAEDKRSSTLKLLAIAAALLLLLGGGAWFIQRSSSATLLDAPDRRLNYSDLDAVAVEKANKAFRVAVPAPVVVPPSVPVVPPPAPVAAAVEPVAAPIPAVAAPAATDPKTRKRYRIDIRKSGCEPNERWRAEARSNLQEIQQAAAARNDRKAWAQFENAESEITPAIGSASTGTECEAVDQKIQKLAAKFKP